MALQLPADAARDDSLVADLSEDTIGISTGFTGASVLLFGATDGEGDVAIVVRAPNSSVVVRRKERIAGIWVNADELTFDDAPGFYHVAASRPLDDLLPKGILEANEIGVANIAFSPHDFLSDSDEEAFRAALVRNKQRAGLYSETTGDISFRGDRLFRTRLELPANVPTGQYDVSVYLIEDGSIVDWSSSSLVVEKVGFEAKLTEFAFEQAPLYGIIAILIALFAGWFAGFVFRKV
ncbi:MAG: TIGR02186 family protein [Alphaproteobacteria bacterium]|nr:TIGR02186 family protein [Alphaproteobacteria bacterium]